MNTNGHTPDYESASLDSNESDSDSIFDMGSDDDIFDQLKQADYASSDVNVKNLFDPIYENATKLCVVYYVMCYHGVQTCLSLTLYYYWKTT